MDFLLVIIIVYWVIPFIFRVITGKRRISRWQVLECCDHTWKSAGQIWVEVHSENRIELGRGISLNLTMYYLEYHEKWRRLEKQDRTRAEFSETDDKLINEAQATFYRLRKPPAEPQTSKKRMPFRQLVWGDS